MSTDRVEVDDPTFAMLAAVNVVAKELKILWMVAGASARVMLLEGVYGLQPGRATRDLDLGVMVANWDDYQRLVEGISSDRRFERDPGQRQRLRFVDEGTVDLVPFGGIESDDGIILWPPDNSVAMKVMGFQEAYGESATVKVRSLDIRVVDPVGLTLLKLLAWGERHLESPGRDASDLAYLLRHFAQVITEAVLFEEHFHAMEQSEFDLDLGASRTLGAKVAGLAGDAASGYVSALLAKELAAGTDSQLVREIARYMQGTTEQRTLDVLISFQLGFGEGATPDHIWKNNLYR